ncbi:T9SS type A sorting domain-containing protein [Gracilimonas sediminicola]|uniref:T9SS type A sorting domain-containing protein n=1 Tax=Gracilimonas sediminicola TaxID=2952158 RepID=A0A9X2L396_9BACT|nr:T9SS type A sorting domain-containing protein [Gracilimonas sediminicola]MCP9291482.1 T9SS type A sorting domain-containing protein [Gracilimonas sediminicola]
MKKIIGIILFTLTFISHLYGFQSDPEKLVGENLIKGFTELANLRGGTRNDYNGLQESYLNKKKDLMRMTASIPVEYGIGGSISMYIDLNDYYSSYNTENPLTLEGSLGWITVWVDARVSLSVGVEVPLGIGLSQVEFDEGNEDAKRPMTIGTISGTIPFLQINSFDINLRENSAELFNVETNPVTEISLEALSLNGNVQRFEIKKNVLDEIIGTAILSSANNQTNILSILPTNSQQVFFNVLSSFFEFEGWKIKVKDSVYEIFDQGSYREITTSDNATSPAEYDGLINHAKGGMDLDNDGVPDNYYPIIPYAEFLYWFGGNGGYKFDIDFKNTGNNTTDFVVKVESFPDGWNVGADDGDNVTSNIDRKFKVIDVLPNELASVYFHIVVFGGAAESGEVKFGLYKDDLFNELLDEITIKVFRVNTVNNEQPTIVLESPDQDIYLSDSQGTIPITWTDLDNDDNAFVNLALDPDIGDDPWEGEENHIWIETGIEENSEIDSFDFETLNLETGEYSLWGVIFDGVNEPAYSKAQGIVTFADEFGKFSIHRINQVIGESNTPFDFDINYKSYVNHNRDLHDINVVIGDNAYDLESDETDIQNGITYSIDGLTFPQGEYEYYFTSEYMGETIRYPKVQNYTFSVGQSAEGYDVAMSGASGFSPSLPDFGNNISVEAWVSNEGVETYDEVEVTVRLVNPNGTTEDTDAGTISNLQPTYNESIDLSLTMPSNGSDGTYRIIYTADGGLDENIDNNVFTKSFYLGELLGTESYRAKSDEVIYDQGDTFSINGHSFEITSVSDGQVVFLNSGDHEDFYNGQIAIYDDIDVAIHVQDAYSYFYNGGWVEQVILIPLESTTSAPSFPAENLYFTQGEQHTTIVQLPSGYNYDEYLIIDEDGYEDEIDSWIGSINEVSGNRLEIVWDIPSNEPIDRHEIYFQTEYTNANNMYNNVYLNIVAPSPNIESLSKNQFSADDIITISGSNFTSTQGTVKFNEEEGDVNSWSTTQISVTVPEGITDGALLVRNANGPSNAKSYQVISSTGDPIVQQRIPNQVIKAGDTLYVAQLANTFNDPNDDNLTYSSEVDSGVVVLSSDLENGDLRIAADSGAAGLYSVIISATDADAAVVSDTFSVDVEKLIDPSLVPTLIYPANNAVDIPLTFNFEWSSAPNVLSYDFQVSDTSDFSTYLLLEESLTDTTITSSDLSYNENYYWRVRANFDGEVGDWSGAFQFSTEELIIEPITVYFDSLSGFVNSNLQVPVYIGETSNQFFESFHFELGFDPTLIEFTSLLQDSTLSESFSVQHNISEPGRLLVNGATSEAVTGSGKLITLNFQLTNEGSSSLNWISFHFNEGSPESNPVNGDVGISIPPINCGDVSNDGTVTNFDATKVLRHVVMLEELVGEDSVRADVTANSWISSYDASQILKHIVGKPHIFNCGQSSAKWAYTPVEVSYDWFIDSENKESTTYQVPINVMSDQIVEAVDLSIEVSEEIKFKGISNTQEGWMLYTNRVGQAVYVSLVGSEALGTDLLGIAEFEIELPVSHTVYLTGEIKANDNEAIKLGRLILHEVPSEFALAQNYPNPFNPVTRIKYSVPKKSDVKIVVYNLLGQEVAELVNESKDPGNYSVSWDASANASGLYVYRLISGSNVITNRMILIK